MPAKSLSTIITPFASGTIADILTRIDLPLSRGADAEAVVEWLDAGVILLSGRSEFHRHLRGAGTGGLLSREIDILRRSNRRC